MIRIRKSTIRYDISLIVLKLRNHVLGARNERKYVYGEGRLYCICKILNKVTKEALNALKNILRALLAENLLTRILKNEKR